MRGEGDPGASRFSRIWRTWALLARCCGSFTEQLQMPPQTRRWTVSGDGTRQGCRQGIQSHPRHDSSISAIRHHGPVLHLPEPKRVYLHRGGRRKSCPSRSLELLLLPGSPSPRAAMLRSAGDDKFGCCYSRPSAYAIARYTLPVSADSSVDVSSPPPSPSRARASMFSNSAR